MKHGDIVYRYSWSLGWSTLVAHPFRYRFDPVPGIHKTLGTWFGCYYKIPRVMNEKRQWFASEGYGRWKRNPLNLPNPYDDWPRADRRYDKSWKKSKKVTRQYMKNI